MAHFLISHETGLLGLLSLAYLLHINFLFFRSALDQHYKLERWQIGEIASKIGQLYYNY